MTPSTLSFKAKTSILWLLLFGLVPLLPAPAQSTEPTSKSSMDQPAIPLIPPVWKDLGYLFSQRDFYYTVGGLALAPVALHDAFKHESPELTEHWGHSQGADNFFEAGEYLGNGKFPLASSVLLIGIGKLGGGRKVQKLGSDLLRASFATGLVTVGMKLATRRTRPNGGPYSYPSGHSSSTFAMAGVIYKDLGKTWGIPAFAVASYVGLSRLQENKHYTSDVVAGAVLGSFIAFKLAGHNEQEKSLSFSPSPQGAGLELSLRF